MTALASALEQAARDRRRRAVRHLLRAPLVLAEREPEVFAAVRAEGEALGRWFSERAGWSFHVDPAAGVARLFKRPAAADASRPARLSGKPPFDRRRYTLFAFALAALDGAGGQVTLRQLASEVKARTADAELPAFDPDQRSERLAFVDVLRLLEELGVLALREWQAETYAQSSSGDALYDIQERVLGLLVATALPPSLAPSAEALARDDGYPDSDDGRRMRARHALFRRLLDDSAVYLDELSEGEREYLNQAAGHLYGELAAWAGLTVERRAEGVAAIDPEGEVTDDRFPDGSSTAKHAALLLVEWLGAEVRERGQSEVSRDACVERMQALFDDYGARCRWSSAYAGGRAGVERLAADALTLLAAFRLVRPTGSGWQPLAAIARFVPAAPEPGEGRRR